jgi:hypothetical protein
MWLSENRYCLGVYKTVTIPTLVYLWEWQSIIKHQQNQIVAAEIFLTSPDKVVENQMKWLGSMTWQQGMDAAGLRWGPCHHKRYWRVVYSDSRYSNRRNVAWSDTSAGLQIAQTWFLPRTETGLVIPSPLWHHGGREYGLSITSSK